MARIRDRNPLQLAQSSPSDNAPAVAVGSNIVLTFNQAVTAGAGTITIYATTATGSHHDTIQITDTSIVAFASKTVTINLAHDLDPGTNYYVLVDAGAIMDLAGHSFAGITSPTGLNFTTVSAPSGGSAGAVATGISNANPVGIGPWLETLTPADESTVSTSANIVLTFTEDVQAGSGSIEIRHSTNGTLFKSIAFSDTSQVQITGNTVTVNPNVDLAPGTGYYLLVEADAVRDLSGDPFEGYGSSGYNFATVGVPGVTLTGNARTNTLTGGVGNDTISGLGAKDTLTGAGGLDTFVYKSVTDSTGAGYDTIADFNVGFDRFDLWFEVTGINRDISVGSVGARRFDADLSVAIDSAHLSAHHAVLFNPSSGSFSGSTFLVIDANGVAGYQAGADLVILLGANSTGIDSLTTYDFI